MTGTPHDVPVPNIVIFMSLFKWNVRVGASDNVYLRLQHDAEALAYILLNGTA